MAGSPGPLDRKTPSGWRASTSADVVDAGTTSTVPSPARWRTIVRLIPKSKATIRLPVPGPPSAPTAVYGAGAGHVGDEIDAVGAGLGRRGLPQCGLIRRSEGARPSHPVSRRMRVSRRVSMPPIALMPWCASIASSDCSARWLLCRRASSRTITPRQNGRSRLEILGVRAVVADVRVGERDDLPGVRRVGDDLLVAGHHRVEHHFAAGDAIARLGPEQLALEHAAIGQHQAAASRIIGQPSA